MPMPSVKGGIMRPRVFVLVLITVMIAAVSVPQVGAQATSGSQQAGDTIVQVIAGTAKPGSEAQYIEARKRHVEWHRSKNDAWAWHAYDVITGESTGLIVTVSSPHKWADRDAREQFVREDQAD